jgi:hypothetical protein
MDLDDVAIGVVQEDLVPTSDSPNAVIRVTNTELIEPPFERHDVIGTETEMPVMHRVDELLHFEPGKQILLGEMKFDGAVAYKINFAVVANFRTAVVNARSPIVDCAEVEDRLIEARKTTKVVGTQVEVMEFEIHDSPVIR